MRTTVTLDKDVAAAVDKLRRERGIGLSEAVNDLVRLGLLYRPRRKKFKQRSQPMGALIDLTDVAEAIEQAEGPLWR